MKGEARRSRRGYSPKLEALEALRLLDSASASILPPVAAWVDAPSSPAPQLRAAWDLAIDLSDLESVSSSVSTSPTASKVPDSIAVGAGLEQMNRYLGRAWVRAGVPPHQHEDCTQAVFATMLQSLGRPGFDRVLADVGDRSIPEVLNRDQPYGLDFLRAVDMVKKRAIRQRAHLVLDEQLDVPASATADPLHGALYEAIDRSLNRREAELIRATLEGFSPAEIAERWGVTPKTISNEKSRAIQKLRDALVPELVG